MKAVAKGIRVSSRKMNVVASLVRDRTVDEAITILENTPRNAAKDLREVVKSAAANAEHNDKYDTSQLYINSIEVNGAGMMKRPEFRAQGRVNMRKSRMSNVAITLDTLENTGENHGS